ncbi:hypothetical protein M5X02_07625 [Paenibacillus alvei]|uniref:hypothetical protein n=1 Tax=Paenibacillus alvei TaxID=44250 RepID=UPI0002F90654|nr:hypothetical protein [Paenibacillus alvei]MCY9540538.1 hypothetical protein [Paenibacillus alvei]
MQRTAATHNQKPAVAGYPFTHTKKADPLTISLELLIYNARAKIMPVRQIF